MGFLANKKILITGLLSKHSIAYGIAKACHREGAELAFSYQNERFIDRINKFAAEFDSKLVFPLDVASDEQITDLFAELGKHWDGLDGLVHSIAFAPTSSIEGDFLEGITRESFRIAHEISSYSYPALVKAARPMMQGRKSCALALSYLGATPWDWPRRASKRQPATWLSVSALKASAPTPFLPARSRPWPPPVLATSANCCRTTRTTPHCVVT